MRNKDLANKLDTILERKIVYDPSITYSFTFVMILVYKYRRA